MPPTVQEKTTIIFKQATLHQQNAMSLILYNFHFEEGSLFHPNSYKYYFSGTLLFLTTYINNNNDYYY